jgi:hypothetical protein
VPLEIAPDAAVEPPPAEPAPATTGVIEGTVTSLENGAPVAAAKVYVRGEPLEAETGTDGRFILTVPPGVHRISIIHGFHDTQTADVEAVAGQTVTITLQLTPAQLEYADFLVTAPRIKGTVAAVMEERRESASVVDAISVADISRSPDGTASAATRRIVGATIVGGQYLFVRGLGGRYVNVRLNGVPLPSTDPDLPGFQLDLFPASLLSSLSIAKTFTPDIPGDFAGGSMNVVTRDFPDDFTLTASVGPAPRPKRSATGCSATRAATPTFWASMMAPASSRARSRIAGSPFVPESATASRVTKSTRSAATFLPSPAWKTAASSRTPTSA